MKEGRELEREGTGTGIKKIKHLNIGPQGPHNRLGSKMNGNGKLNEERNGNRNEREREAK